MAMLSRAKMGVGTKRDIRKTHRLGKKTLKQRRKRTAKFLRHTVGKSRKEVRQYKREHKKTSKQALGQRKDAMYRRQALMQAYRAYSHKRAKIHKKWPKDSSGNKLSLKVG